MLGLRDVIAVDRCAERFARPEHLTTLRSAPAMVASRQVEQLECSLDGEFTSFQAPLSRCRHRATTAYMRRRSPSSSTLRERFPCDGRTLIIESNSIQSDPCLSGYMLIPQISSWTDPSSRRSASSLECGGGAEVEEEAEFQASCL